MSRGAKAGNLGPIYTIFVKVSKVSKVVIFAFIVGEQIRKKLPSVESQSNRCKGSRTRELKCVIGFAH